MPTNHIVLCCVNCSMFQAQQSKKCDKWVCKVCSTKQSLTKVFAEAPANQCRAIVQQLNREFLTRCETKRVPNFDFTHAMDDSPNMNESVGTYGSPSDNPSMFTNNLSDTDEQCYRLSPSQVSSKTYPAESTQFKSKWDAYL